jgi:hypothetical protein
MNKTSKICHVAILTLVLPNAKALYLNHPNTSTKLRWVTSTGVRGRVLSNPIPPVQVVSAKPSASVRQNAAGQRKSTDAKGLVPSNPPPGWGFFAKPSTSVRQNAARQRKSTDAKGPVPSNPLLGQTALTKLSSPERMASVKSSALLQKWERVTGVKFKDILTSTYQEIAQIALMNEKLLMATAALMDQASLESLEQKFATYVIRAVEQGICENVPVAIAELNGFSRKGEFSERQLEWLKLLAGATVSGFPYSNCQAFRKDSNANLEEGYDYAHVFFPGFNPPDVLILAPLSEPRKYYDEELCLKNIVKIWKQLLDECPIFWLNFRLNMQFNAIRMFHFWGFKFIFIPIQDASHPQDTIVILGDNPGVQLPCLRWCNTLKVHQFIEALTIFGYFQNLLEILREGSFSEYYPKHPEWTYWTKAPVICSESFEKWA